MNKQQIKDALVYSAKNAVNALLVNTTAWWILPANFNLHDVNAIWNIVKLAIGTVAAREALVWGPKLLAWSKTD
jgi:hypothetical protein